MSVPALWASLTDDEKTLLVEAAHALGADLAEAVMSRLQDHACRLAPPEAVRRALTQAGAAFIAGLERPQDPHEVGQWAVELTASLSPFFADERVRTALIDPPLHASSTGATALGPIEEAWAEHVSSGADPSLSTWRSGAGLSQAADAFAWAFEHAVTGHPDLQACLLAGQVREVIDRIGRGEAPQDAPDALRAVEDLATARETLHALFAHLARMGYSPRGIETRGEAAGSVITTPSAGQVFIPDRGNLAWLFHQLPDREQVLAVYRAHLRRSCARLPLSGLAMPTIGGHPIDSGAVRLPLRRPAVLPRFAPSTPTAAGRAAQPPLEEILASRPQLVILGASGSGKSVLLRHLAWIGADDPDTVPLLIPLNRVDLSLDGKQDLVDAALDYLTAHERPTEGKRLRAALAARVEAGTVLWLWDGLDRVHVHRQPVVEALGQLAAEGHPMIITSRPEGYHPVAGCDQVGRIGPVPVERAPALVRRWFTAFAEACPAVPGPDAESWVEQQVADLRSALEQHPTLRAAMGNPLTLTMVTILSADDNRGHLPRYRKEVYRRYLEHALATTWEAGGYDEEPALAEADDPAAVRDQLLTGLYRAAYWLHSVRKDYPQRAAYDIVLRALTEIEGRGTGLLRRFQVSTRTKVVLEFWEQAGLFERFQVGDQHRLAFRHLTLQEYAAAQALLDAHGDAPAALWADLEPHLTDSSWRDVITLTLAGLEDASPVLQRLLEADSTPPEQHGPLFLAAQALLEGAHGAESTRRLTVQGLEHMACTAQTRETRSDALATLVALGRSGEAYATQRLLALASHAGLDLETREQAARALDELGRTDELLTLSRDSAVDSEIRRVAADTLGRLGRTDDLAEAWSAMANDGRVDPQVRAELACSLCYLGQTEAAGAVLLDLSRDPQVDMGIRQEAAEALTRLDCPTEAAEAWIALALDMTAPGSVRQEASAALERLGEEENAIRAWRSVAQAGTVPPSIRAEAAEALSRLGRTDAVVEVWESLALDSSADARLRREAAFNLIYKDRLQSATAALVALISDNKIDSDIRREASEALRHLGREDEAAQAWLRLAQDTLAGGRARLDAAAVLRQLGRVAEAADALLSVATDHRVNQWTRVEAAKALTQTGRAQEAAEVFLELAADGDLAWWIREGAIRSLGDLGHLTDTTRIVAGLQELVVDSAADNEVRKAAQRALQRLGVRNHLD
jgi:uncharacterized protein (UPF0147 family)